MILKPGDIILTQDKGFFAWLARKTTQGRVRQWKEETIRNTKFFFVVIEDGGKT